MKNIFNGVSLQVFAALVITLILFSFSEQMPEGYDARYDSPHYSQTTSDTISGTENDTIEVNFLCQSLWTYQHSIYGTQDTATMNVITILQQNDFDSGNATLWYEIERDTLVSGSNPVFLNGSAGLAGVAYVKGKRQRIILDGINGTQDTRYTVRTILKQPSK